MITAIDKFRERKVKAKDVFYIKLIDKSQAYDFVKTYHYLKDAKFFSKFAYGLFYKHTDLTLGAILKNYRNWTDKFVELWNADGLYQTR